MKVLNLQSDRHPETTIDVFVIEPFDFNEEYSRAVVQELAPGCPVPLVSLDTLIKRKEAAGRPRDIDDAWHLRKLKEELSLEDMAEFVRTVHAGRTARGEPNAPR